MNRSSIPLILGLGLVVAGTAFLVENLTGSRIWPQLLPWWPVILLIMGTWALARGAVSLRTGRSVGAGVWIGEAIFALVIVFWGVGLTQLAELGVDWGWFEPALVTEEKEERRSFRFQGKNIFVTAGTANISVVGWKKKRVELTVTTKASGTTRTAARRRLRSRRARFRIERDKDSATIKFLDSRFPLGNGPSVKVLSLQLSSGQANIDASIKVPRNVTVDVDTATGQVFISDIRNDIKARSTVGPVRVARIIGDADLATEIGPIRASKIKGELEAVSDIGPITVLGSNGPVSLRSDIGGISLEDPGDTVWAITEIGPLSVVSSRSPSDTWVLGTELGPIKIFLPRTARFDLDAAGEFGNISGSLIRGSRTSFSGNSLEQAVNGGGPTIKIRTEMGPIRLNANSR